MLKRDTLTVFLPINKCVISPLKKIIGNVFMYRSLEIKEYINHFGIALNKARLSYPKRLIVFAHPDDNRLGLKIQGKGNIFSLYPEWWKRPDNSPYEFLFGFVCEGNLIFKQNQWRLIFPYWISFKRKVKIFALSMRSKSSYKLLYKGILKEVNKDQSINACEQKIKLKFKTIISDLYENHKKENGDNLTLLYLIDAYNSLCTSEDRNGIYQSVHDY